MIGGRQRLGERVLSTLLFVLIIGSNYQAKTKHTASAMKIIRKIAGVTRVDKIKSKTIRRELKLVDIIQKN